MRKVSVKKLKSFAKEEKMASKEYARLGFKKQARDEHDHHEYFERIIKKKNKKKKKSRSIWDKLISN